MLHPTEPMNAGPRCPSCGSQLASPNAPCTKCLLALGRGERVLATDADARSVDPRSVDPRSVDPRSVDPRSADARDIDQRRLPSDQGYSGTMPTLGHAYPGMSLPNAEQLAGWFPQLEILNLVGRGGMGAVYRARQKSLDRNVALKIISPHVAGDASFAERFAREARTLAKLNHPHVVNVYDFGQNDGGYFLLMEFVDGVTLRQAIAARTIEPTRALRIVSEVCDALQYAHEQGVVHRDIKPENILLDARGSVKIADFGLAKLLGGTAAEVSLTATRQVLGTAHYIAPEQLERPEAVDSRADIYSLGVVFYELLTGHLPLGRFALPSEEIPAIDRRIDPVVLRTLEREPKQRYQLASQLRSDIDQLASTPAPPFPRADSPSIGFPPTTATAPTYGAYPSPPAGYQPPPLEAVNPPPNRSGTISVPFTIEDIFAGLAQLSGILHFDGQTLRAEWQVSDAVLNTFTGNVKTITIPVDQIASAKVVNGFWSTRLELVARSIATFGDLRCNTPGKLALKIARSDRPIAETCATKLQQSIDASATPWPPTQMPVGQGNVAGQGNPIGQGNVAGQGNPIGQGNPPTIGNVVGTSLSSIAQPPLKGGRSPVVQDQTTERLSQSIRIAGASMAAIGMMSPLMALIGSIAIFFDGNANDRAIGIPVMSIVSIPSLLMIAGGIAALLGRGRPLVMVASIIAIIPSSMCFPGSTAIGIWLLYLITRPGHENHFDPSLTKMSLKDQLESVFGKRVFDFGKVLFGLTLFAIFASIVWYFKDEKVRFQTTLPEALQAMPDQELRGTIRQRLSGLNVNEVDIDTNEKKPLERTITMELYRREIQSAVDRLRFGGPTAIVDSEDSSKSLVIKPEWISDPSGNSREVNFSLTRSGTTALRAFIAQQRGVATTTSPDQTATATATATVPATDDQGATVASAVNDAIDQSIESLDEADWSESTADSDLAEDLKGAKTEIAEAMKQVSAIFGDSTATTDEDALEGYRLQVGTLTLGTIDTIEIDGAIATIDLDAAIDAQTAVAILRTPQLTSPVDLLEIR
jgi:serine/threonine protein kinase